LLPPIPLNLCKSLPYNSLSPFLPISSLNYCFKFGVFENILQFTPTKLSTLIKSTDKTGLQGEASQETPRKVQPEKGNGNRMAGIG
jgi:hypothetical protein